MKTQIEWFEPERGLTVNLINHEIIDFKGVRRDINLDTIDDVHWCIEQNVIHLKKEIELFGERKHRTIRDMRFELRMLDIENIHDFSDEEVVQLFNDKFGNGKNFVGIDRDGGHEIFIQKVKILEDEIQELYNIYLSKLGKYNINNI